MGEGGLAPLATFLRAFPPRSSMAVVVVGPNGTANDVARLQSETALKVEVAVDRGELLADHVYLVPDAREVDARDGCLVLRAGDGHPGRIDRFFRGMLVAFGKQVVALVLSGDGDDGAAGIKRVKEDGGLTLAQEPDEATHDAMPRGALATGLVDLVLPVAELPARIVDAWRAAAEHVPGEAVPDVSADALRELLALLKVRTGHDFSNYKSATLLRRIDRRMLICRSDSAHAYVRHVRDEPSELAALLRDFLISVTNFFRDPLAYEQVALRVIGPLFRDRRDRAPTEPVRLWVAGCATGEEAYSLAILCAEQFALFDEPPPVQIFATDIDAHALSLARIGSFSSTIASDVAPARLERFFSRQGTAHYRVRKEIREMVLFSPHNLLRDPPFSRLDVASCRNVLIYFNRQAQDRVLGLLHFGLRTDGHLFLGSAESAESAPSLFQPTDARHRL
jgi:two-component system CheB/CheR fusion protein